MAPSPILKITGPEGTLPSVPVTPGLTIGRATECDLRLSGGRVSRRHAVLAQQGDGWAVVDKGSSFGTFLNGRRLAADVPEVLKNGDVLLIDAFRVQFCAEAPPPASAAVPPKAGAAEEEDQPIARDTEFQEYSEFYTDEIMAVKRKIHSAVLIRLNLPHIATSQIKDDEMRSKLITALDAVMREMRHEIPNVNMVLFKQVMMDELIGYGPISPMLRSEKIGEVMVNGPSHVFIERAGRLFETTARFMDNSHLSMVIQRIVEPVGRNVDEASTMVDARLPDGSRVNAIIQPLSLDGASLTIRKFASKRLTWEDLVAYGSMTPDMARFLEESVRAKRNIVVSGGTGSGKTTLLNVLSLFIPQGERLVTIEDSAELKLVHRNLVRLEARPSNIEGRGKITIRDLVINALRMRPDRVIVGECRGAEALDMLQAMNTGHDGSLTTLHANHPRDALMRLENLVMMAGFELPSSAIREQISSAINIIVQQSRFPDGSRRVTHITEVTGREGDVIQMQDIFLFRQEGYDANHKIVGTYSATGNIPLYVHKLKEKGDLRLDMSIFVPKG